MPIEVREYGSAHPTLVVLHGGPGGPGSARGLAEACSRRHRVLEPLQRWSGAVPLSVATHVEDLREVAPNPAILIGHSWGAMLALSFAACFAERVRGLVLVGCGMYSDAGRAGYRSAMNTRFDAARRQRQQELRAEFANAGDAQQRDRLGAERARLAAEAMTVDALEPPAVTTMDTLGFEQTWDDALRLQREGLEPARFANIRAPVLMLHGEDDPHAGPTARDDLRPYIPQLEYVGFPRCGHEPWRERHAREAFLETLFAWLGSLR